MTDGHRDVGHFADIPASRSSNSPQANIEGGESFFVCFIVSSRNYIINVSRTTFLAVSEESDQHVGMELQVNL